MNDDQRLTRIAALLRQAEGTDNEHEADAFMQAAQRLATASSIDLAVARAHTSNQQQRSVPSQKAIHIGTPGTRGLRTYVELFLAISHANDLTCDIARNSSTVYCYGFANDVSTCEALYASLAVQMVRASDSYIKSGAHRSELIGKYVTTRNEWGSGQRWVETPVNATTARINFQQAFARRIGTRLQEAQNAARAEAIASDGHPGEPESSRAAAGSSTELVLRDKQLEIRDFYKQTSTARGSWAGRRAQAGYSSHARMAGDRAARTARLGGEWELGGSRQGIAGARGVSM